MSDANPAITLRPIDFSNWETCIALKVEASQERFVASNAKSLAQAAFETQDGVCWQPHGIYAGDDMVGFLMYGSLLDHGKPVWFVLRLMIDHQQQRQGYGRAALRRLLGQLRVLDPSIDDVYISFVPDNTAARSLYMSLGFRDVGLDEQGGDWVMHRRLDNAPEQV